VSINNQRASSQVFQKSVRWPTDGTSNRQPPKEPPPREFEQHRSRSGWAKRQSATGSACVAGKFFMRRQKTIPLFYPQHDPTSNGSTALVEPVPHSVGSGRADGNARVPLALPVLRGSFSCDGRKPFPSSTHNTIQRQTVPQHWHSQWHTYDRSGRANGSARKIAYGIVASPCCSAH
jgi:hypothetical protein